MLNSGRVLRYVNQLITAARVLGVIEGSGGLSGFDNGVDFFNYFGHPLSVKAELNAYCDNIF